MQVIDRVLILTNTDLDHILDHLGADWGHQIFAKGLDNELFMHGIEQKDFDRIEVDLDPRDRGHLTLGKTDV